MAIGQKLTAEIKQKTVVATAVELVCAREGIVFVVDSFEVEGTCCCQNQSSEEEIEFQKV